MILPIVAYGNPILRKAAEPITADYPGLATLINDMWETMYASCGVGLAGPQVNKPIRLFVIDSAQIFANMQEDEERYPDEPGIKKVFINAELIDLTGEEWVYNEGCLSIPKIREDIQRPELITGLTARIIQHEYDHIDGKLFIDYLKPLKKKLLQGKLNDISKGKIKVDYKMLFAK
jgi:peptide deformylase